MIPSRGGKKEVGTLRAMVRMAFDAPKLLPFARGSPAHRVRYWAKHAPESIAIVFGSNRITWREVDEAADRIARWLRREGVARGNVVAVMMDNRPELVFLFTAISRIGAVAALMNAELRGEPFAHAMRICEPVLSVIGSEHICGVLQSDSEIGAVIPDKLVVQRRRSDDDVLGLRAIDDELDGFDDAASPPDPILRNNDVCCYVYTSGTTGLPKAAVVRNQRILGGGFTFGNMMHRSQPGDLIYVALPLFHSSALFLGWGAALATGAAIGLRARFSASEFWQDVVELRATSFLYIGEMCRYLLNSPPKPEDRLHGLRVGVGNGMRPELWEKFQSRFGIPVIREFYGATEGNVPLLNMEGRPGMLGKIQRGQFIARCDQRTGKVRRGSAGLCERVEPEETGLLLGKISRLMRFDGYVDEVATREKILRSVRKSGDTYFDTGDLVKLHAGGWLSFVDRIGDTYRWKGENVSTQEVSAILSAAPGVCEALVYGVEIPGCEGRAGMTALSVDSNFDLERFAHFVAESLPPYQRPLFVRLLEEQVRTTSTFKQCVSSYRDEGFDPGETADAILVSTGDGFCSLDSKLHREILEGKSVPAWGKKHRPACDGRRGRSAEGGIATW